MSPSTSPPVEPHALRATPPHEAGAPPAGTRRRPIDEAAAIEIWIARWLKVPRKELIARYGCDPRRLYEVWQGERHPASRETALRRFEECYPGLVGRIDAGFHRPMPRTAHPDQLRLFD